MERQTDRWTNGQTDGQMVRWMDGQTDGWTDRLRCYDQQTGQTDKRGCPYVSACLIYR